ncbi:glycosyltransferase [Ramlibacter monticola]|uniref:Glycosyltransferase n=1 Tax=Ramlibacter monticola TaxID=1926872 RepID=A0A936Z0Z0_9BURK|nr:glycosyltransferase [Ramlibacter monticola]MBL0392084.1 glycosyltransferase [Ramlibacter monticola]
MTSATPGQPHPLARQRILFIHQNFPGQFVHLAQELVRLGCEVKALAIEQRAVPGGVDVRRYEVRPETLLPREDIGADMEVKTRRALACAAAMRKLAAEGFQPSLIVAHPGWGESLFCKDVWPDAVLVAYGEFYYQADGADFGFDPEFSRATVDSRMRLRMRNTALLHAYQAADAILCPTHWQRSCLPREFQAKTTVIFDGVDTRVVRPEPSAFVRLGRSGLQVGRNDSVLTFVNRNLEPYRGFHVFMRALPEILARNPRTRCVIVGDDSVSYGTPPRSHRNWREAMLQEVGSRLPADRIHFVGCVAYADYLRLLQVSTCHAYLTYPFVLSWSCIEALACGCRVVGSATPPVREVITPGHNGLLFDFFDVAGLARTVSDVLQDPGAYDPLAATAVREARAKYDLETVCKPQQVQWLASLLRDAPRP